MVGQEVRGATRRDSVLVALGLPRGATPADTADFVAAAAGLYPPKTALDVVLLADVIDALAETCRGPSGQTVDAAEVADAALGRLRSRWSPDQWREVGRNLGADRLDDAVTTVVAARFAPRLGKAGLVQLVGDGP